MEKDTHTLRYMQHVQGQHSFFQYWYGRLSATLIKFTLKLYELLTAADVLRIGAYVHLYVHMCMCRKCST